MLTLPVITQCCMEALYKLGKTQQQLVDIAKRFERRRCNHREAIDPSACLKDVVGSSNKHRYILAIQDPALRNSLSSIPGLPIIHFNPRGVLVLSPPSDATLRVKFKGEEERRLEGVKEMEGVVDGGNVVGSSGQAVHVPAEKRGKRKAPNPMSVKKKKVVPQEAKKNKTVAFEGDATATGKKRSRGEEQGTLEVEDVENEHAATSEPSTRKKRKRSKGKSEVARAIAELDGTNAGSEVGQVVRGSDEESD
jgi:U3 small nucleolar RNA-associated protein 23